MGRISHEDGTRPVEALELGLHAADGRSSFSAIAIGHSS